MNKTSLYKHIGNVYDYKEFKERLRDVD